MNRMTNYGYEAAKESINESLRKLQTDYLDLMLLHLACQSASGIVKCRKYQSPSLSLTCPGDISVTSSPTTSDSHLSAL